MVCADSVAAIEECYKSLFRLGSMNHQCGCVCVGGLSHVHPIGSLPFGTCGQMELFNR